MGIRSLRGAATVELWDRSADRTALSADPSARTGDVRLHQSDQRPVRRGASLSGARAGDARRRSSWGSPLGGSGRRALRATSTAGCPCRARSGLTAMCMVSTRPASMNCADGAGSAAEAHVLPVGRRASLSQHIGGFAGDEVERGVAQAERRPRVVGEDEHRGVERRLVAPPALPLLVRPRPAERAELVAAHDLRADVLLVVAGEVVLEPPAAAAPRKAAVPNRQAISSRGSTCPKGVSSDCGSPAPKPSAETVKLCTRSS